MNTVYQFKENKILDLLQLNSYFLIVCPYNTSENSQFESHKLNHWW